MKTRPASLRSSLLFVAVGLALTPAALVGCGGPAPAVAITTATQAQPTAVATRGSVTVRLPARVVIAEARSMVSAPATSRVVRVLARPGDRVDKGSVVVEVVMPDVLAAAADLIAADARGAAWQRRVQQLGALRAAGLARASDEAEAEVALAEAHAARARAVATLRSAGVSPSNAEGLLAGGVVSLRSPAAGVVASLDGVEGEILTAGHTIALIVGSTGAPRIVARAVAPPTGDATLLIGGRRLPLTSLAVVPRVEGGDGARDLWFAMTDDKADRPATQEPDPELVDGALGTVEVTVEGGASVPAAAVVLDPAGARVARQQGNGFARVDVIVRGRGLDGALVVDGLAPGDAVSLTPHAVLDGGTP